MELSSKTLLKIIIIEDSAGDNLAAELVLMVLQSGSTKAREDILLELDGLMLIYLFLDMNIAS